MTRSIPGLEKFCRQLRDYGDGFRDGAFEGQLENGKRVLIRAKVYCPIETGALRSTGRLEAELREVHRASVDVVFGGADSVVDYAVVVHEDLSLRHNPPTQAKYLQRAVDEIAPEMSTRIGEHAVAAAKRRIR